jgi:hypothetical protein
MSSPVQAMVSCPEIGQIGDAHVCDDRLEENSQPSGWNIGKSGWVCFPWFVDKYAGLFSLSSLVKDASRHACPKARKRYSIRRISAELVIPDADLILRLNRQKIFGHITKNCSKSVDSQS